MARQAHLQAILSAVDKISPTLRKIQTRVGMMHKTFRDVGSSSRNVLSGIGLPATLGLGALTFGLVGAARAALDYAGAIQDARDNTGLSGRAVQEYGTVFEAAGVQQDEFLAATEKLNKGLADAAAGKDKSLLSLLTKLRIPLRNMRGEIRSVEELLPELSDAFAKNENPAVRTRMAMELFGKSGGRLIAVLAQGGKSLVEARREVQRLGAVLDEEATGRLDDLGDAFGVLHRQVRVQTAAAFAAAAPAILAATKGLQEWIAKNKDLLQQRVAGYIRRLAESLLAWVESGGIERLGAQIERVIDGVAEFIRSVGGMGNVLKALGVLVLIGPVASLFQLGTALVQLGIVLGGPLIAGLASLAAALGGVQFVMAGMTVSLGALTIAALPWIVAIAAIAAGAYLIYRNWDRIGPFFAKLWDGIVDKVQKSVARITELVAQLNPLREVGGAIGGFLADAFIPDPMQQMQTSGRSAGGGPLAGAGPLGRAGALQSPAARMQGEMRVRFENAPAGMRVEPGPASPGMAMNVDVGRRNTGSLG